MQQCPINMIRSSARTPQEFWVSQSILIYLLFPIGEYLSGSFGTLSQIFARLQGTCSSLRLGISTGRQGASKPLYLKNWYTHKDK